MLSRIKFSTAIYLLTLILLTVWLIKSYFDFKNINSELKKNSKKIVILEKKEILNKTAENINQKYRRISDGIFVESKDLSQNYPIVIIIENLLESRPQAGLDQARVVYEVAVEGGITRFLALFDSLDNIDRIGPVRSVRPYFLDWAEEFGQPVFLHVGGSADALNKINNRNIINIDEFYLRYDYYQRVNDKKRPHNTYTTPELLKKLKNNYKLENKEYDSWVFKDDANISDRGDISIEEIDFSNLTYDYEDDYTVSWKYNKNDNNYIRKQGIYPHKLENDIIIQAKNIIIMYTEEKIIDDIGRLKIKTTGEGRLQIFQDGNIIEGKWKKANFNSRTKFYNNTDEEIKFNAGQTWIEVIPINNEVIYK